MGKPHTSKFRFLFSFYIIEVLRLYTFGKYILCEKPWSSGLYIPIQFKRFLNLRFPIYDRYFTKAYYIEDATICYRKHFINNKINIPVVFYPVGT